MKRTLLLLTVVTLGLAAPSCTNNQIPFLPAASNVAVSTYSVQKAEQVLAQAKSTFDLFFGLVHDNHDFVVTHLPQVYTFALRMQVEAPAAMRQGNAAKNAFKYNRTADGQTDLNSIMHTIASLMVQVQSNTNKLKASTP